MMWHVPQVLKVPRVLKIKSDYSYLFLLVFYAIFSNLHTYLVGLQLLVTKVWECATNYMHSKWSLHTI